MHLLVDYSSDSDSELSQSNDDDTLNVNSKRLPVPSCLLDSTKRDEVIDDPSQNEGRIRSFAHQRGNWASLVYVPYFERCSSLSVLYERIISEFNSSECEIKPVTQPHISVTRTFILLYHWIQEFVSTARTCISKLHSFRLELVDFDVYVNDERTRTFLGLTVGAGSDSLAQAVTFLDSCLHQYKLKPFYEEGRFHMSVCWCLGDKQDYFLSVLPSLRRSLASFIQDYPESLSIAVTFIECKVGNRLYKFNLVPKQTIS